MKIYWTKLTASIGSLLSTLVYNFHKRVPGVKTTKNIKYKNKPTRFNKMDIHYRESDYKNKTRRPIIVYFHGGGWTNYSNNIYTTLNRRMADMGYIVFSADYGLSPKYKLDNIIDDCISALNKAVKMAELFGGNPNQIILAGDSAGAHIASFITALAKNGCSLFRK